MSVFISEAVLKLHHKMLLPPFFKYISRRHFFFTCFMMFNDKFNDFTFVSTIRNMDLTNQQTKEVIFGGPSSPTETSKVMEIEKATKNQPITIETGAKKVDPLTIFEAKSRTSKIILEDKPVCPGDDETPMDSKVDEEPTKPSQEEKPVCPGDENIARPSTPVKLVEVIKNKGEVTIFKEKSKKKKWNPFKKSHKVIEKRREQQIVEYGPPEEPCKEEKPVCLGDANITY